MKWYLDPMWWVELGMLICIAACCVDIFLGGRRRYGEIEKKEKKKYSKIKKKRYGPIDLLKKQRPYRYSRLYHFCQQYDLDVEDFLVRLEDKPDSFNVRVSHPEALGSVFYQPLKLALYINGFLLHNDTVWKALQHDKTCKCCENHKIIEELKKRYGYELV